MKITSTPKLTPEIITAAIEGHEAQKARIDQQIAELRAMLPGGPTIADEPRPPRKRRKLSAAARARIAEAQRKRWAATKKESAPAENPKPARRLSAAGRRRIIEATKKRWAAVRAAKAEQAKAGGKPRARKAAKSAATKATKKAFTKAGAALAGAPATAGQQSA